MRLPNAAHQRHPWVIGRIAPDFRLLDAWALPVRGGRDDFAALLEVMGSLNPSGGRSTTARLLFRLRWQLGRWFGWDDPRRRRPVPGGTETSLSVRLPEDLRGTVNGLRRVGGGHFTPLYLTDDESAAEISNGTVHGVMHLAWVDEGDGHYRGQMGVYVKPRGRRGAVYLALIGPFRHLVVYPALMREIERAWTSRPRGTATPEPRRPAAGETHCPTGRETLRRHRTVVGPRDV